VARIDNGILGKWKGPVGPVTFGGGSEPFGDMDPRYDGYTPSEDQYERRRRFAKVSRILSKVYLAFLKPYYRYPRSFTTALDVAIGETIKNYYEYEDVCYILFYKTNFPHFGNALVLQDPGLEFYWIVWEGTISPYWLDADFVRVFAYQLDPNLKMTYGAPIPVADGRAPFAIATPWGTWVRTFVSVHAYKRFGSSWAISKPFYALLSIGPLI
jgi:hypothetical protein